MLAGSDKVERELARLVRGAGCRDFQQTARRSMPPAGEPSLAFSTLALPQGTSTVRSRGQVCSISRPLFHPVGSPISALQTAPIGTGCDAHRTATRASPPPSIARVAKAGRPYSPGPAAHPSVPVPARKLRDRRNRHVAETIPRKKAVSPSASLVWSKRRNRLSRHYSPLPKDPRSSLRCWHSGSVTRRPMEPERRAKSRSEISGTLTG
jgi:hypothetical protein